MKIYPLAITTLVLTSLATLLPGCGDGRPVRVPVSGKVMIDGQPLKFGRVKFVPADGRPSESTLDENGHFSLTCFDACDGALVGQHQVEVDGSQALNANQVRWHAPAKYAQYHTSGIVHTVDGPLSDLEITLSWDGGQPYVQGTAATGVPERPTVP